jgi:flagellar basal-body rod modification protein FlgD
MVEGAQLALRDGVGRGAVELAGSAQSTRVEVLDGAGQVLGTIELGSREAGIHSFEWPLGARPADAAYGFRVAAAQGSVSVPARTLELQRVQSVSTAGDSLNLNFGNNRSVGVADVVAFN